MMWAFSIVLLMLITMVALPIVSISALMLAWATAHRYMSPVFMFTVIMVFVYLWSMLIIKTAESVLAEKENTACADSPCDSGNLYTGRDLCI